MITSVPDRERPLAHYPRPGSGSQLRLVMSVTRFMICLLSVQTSLALLHTPAGPCHIGAPSEPRFTAARSPLRLLLSPHVSSPHPLRLISGGRREETDKVWANPTNVGPNRDDEIIISVCVSVTDASEFHWFPPDWYLRRFVMCPNWELTELEPWD